jgi:methanol dehydrogenase (cytochrome c) subunit 2
LRASDHLGWIIAVTAGVLVFAASSATAYDGTNCKEPGVCWEAKPGYPEKIAGSKYDPKHDPNEVAKQAQSIKEMDERNRKRVEYFKKTGTFIYDVSKIPSP